MKRLLAYLLLVISLVLKFNVNVKAENISDFQIEGMSIGDTLLNYMKENLIINEINNKDISYYYDDDFVVISTWEIRNKFNTYDDIGVILKQNDKNYIIYGLEGTLYMDKNSSIDECYKIQNKIVKDIKKSLNLKTSGDIWYVEKENLHKHQLSVKYVDFELPEGGAIRTTCYEIKKGVRKYSDVNLLYVTVNSKLFWRYLNY